MVLENDLATTPHMVNINTYLAYKVHPNLTINRKIKAENFDWDLKHPHRLSALCIKVIADNWQVLRINPIVDIPLQRDQNLFLSILDTTLPLQLLVDNIKSDIFWKRAYKARWTDGARTTEQRCWLNLYMEKHFADILENLNPKSYDPEKIMILVNLCSGYIKNLSITSFVPADLPPVEHAVSPEMAEFMMARKENIADKKLTNNETLTRDHIPLHAVLGNLPHLVELHLTFQLKNIGTGFRRDQFQFTNNDAKSVARGLEVCSKLRVFRMTRTDLNCTRVKYILRALSELKRLEILDFSHCNIGDEGALAIAKYMSKHDHLRDLILVDNKFGPDGAEGIGYALNTSTCALKTLNLRLNTKIGSNGVAHIAVALARGCNLIAINLSACGILPGPLLQAPTAVWSTTSLEQLPSCGDLLARAIGLSRTPLRTLDLSVNNIGVEAGDALANAICLSFLVDVNLKRSGMGNMAMAVAEAAAAAQRLRREAERGVRFRRSAGRLVHARRVAKGMNIDTDPILLAHQLSSRPSIVSVTSEEGTYSVQTQPLPTDFGFIPAFKNPLTTSRASSVTGPPTSRRSSHHQVLEPVKEVRRSALVRRGSDGSLLQTRSADSQRRIKIFVSTNKSDSESD